MLTAVFACCALVQAVGWHSVHDRSHRPLLPYLIFGTPRSPDDHAEHAARLLVALYATLFAPCAIPTGLRSRLHRALISLIEGIWDGDYVRGGQAPYAGMAGELLDLLLDRSRPYGEHLLAP